jgi:hypothetical protein
VISAGTPDITFEKREFDFGTIQGGNILDHKFMFKNTGDTDLLITRISAPCGCTAVQVNKAPIKPGQTGEIQARLNTAGFRNQITKYIYVETNVPHMPKITLTMHARVVYDLDIRPGEYVSFFSVKQGETVSRVVLIYNNTDNPLTVAEPKIVNNKSGAFTANLEEEIKGKRFKIKVTFNAGEKPGRFRGELRLKTNNKGKPEIIIPLSAMVLEEVYALPNSVIIQRNRKDRPRFKNISIMNTTDKALKIESVEIDTKFLSYEIKPILRSNNYRLTVSLNGNAPKTVLRGKIKVKTNNKKKPELLIRYYIGAVVEKK